MSTSDLAAATSVVLTIAAALSCIGNPGPPFRIFAEAAGLFIGGWLIAGAAYVVFGGAERLFAGRPFSVRGYHIFAAGVAVLALISQLARLIGRY